LLLVDLVRLKLPGKQYLQVNGLDYYIVGSGSDAANNWAGESALPANTLKFSYPPQNVNIGGFAVATVTDTFFRIDFYNDQGQLLYTSTQSPQIPTPSEPTIPPQAPAAPPVDNENGTVPHEDPSKYTNTVAVLPESTLFGIVLGIVGGLLTIAGAVLIYLMMSERKKKIEKLQRTQRH